MERRQLGSTREQLSIIGFGGILVCDTEPTEASRLVAMAVDAGVNYFDVAPSYGNAEDCLGPALEPYRDGVFLACKTAKRNGAEAGEELCASLKRLRTDHFDLFQLHAMTTTEDLEVATGPGGALEAIVAARDAGLVRYIGFSAHSVEVATELIRRFEFASVLFPLNWMEYHNASFGPQVVEAARKAGVGRLALKAMARQKWQEGADRKAWPRCWYEPCSDPEEARLALRFTLSQAITAAIPPGDTRLFPLALEVGGSFQPVDAGEVAELQRRAEGLEPFFRLAA